MLIQITAGRGPAECELAVSHFITALKHELADVKILAECGGRHKGCLKSVLLQTSSTQITNGTVLWIAQSPFRPKHRRKNWFVGVKIFEDPPTATYETANGDIIFQTFASGGKGGQHVNKTESGVRAIHAPTGLSCVCMEERSQFLNKKTALNNLLQMLKSQKEREAGLFTDELHSQHDELKRGQPMRIYEGAAFKRTL